MTTPPLARFQPFPPGAAWQHREARDGFEVVFFDMEPTKTRIRGHTAAVEQGIAWSVRYEVTLGPRGHVVAARTVTLTATGEHITSLEVSRAGRWRVNGSERHDLDGCMDVDLEASACTNVFPIRRLDLAPGEEAEAPAVYVRAANLGVERLEQSYRRVGDQQEQRRYQYRAPAFQVETVLQCDPSGLVLEYPGLATRVQ
jgi:hypothetical protein